MLFKMKVQIITLLLAGVVGVVLSVRPHRFCYKDFPILDGLLCYKTCASGYAHWGGGPVCWGKCPSSTTDIGLVCTKKTYGRGVGNVLSSCSSSHEKNGALCYPNCKSGYYGVGPVCWAYCKSGYTDDGALCRKDVHIYNRDVSDCPWTDVCGLCGGPWYNICGKRRNCGGKCRSGYTDDGCTCRRDVHIYAKDTYGRGVGSAMGCKRGEEKDGALCYKPCKSGYYGVGPVCWATCSGKTIDTGTQCQKEAYGRGVGKAVNCLKPVSKSNINNFAGLVDLFEKAKGFKSLQSAGCGILYKQLKPWVAIVKTFNSCFSKGKWQTISLSFAAGVAAGVQVSGEIGVASDTKTKKGMCFVGYCYGVKTDVSIGAEIAVGWWRNLNDIPGDSRAYELGIDIPFTEIGFSATFITNTDGEYIGTQFSFGVGVGGPQPVDLGFTKCSTPEKEVINIRI